ncbi:MAG: hypothetical protein J6Y78_03120 [Paludibacteraceae bacterium]|nr:hypothetical protein [Methanobrevibacter sp.]MBP5421414.1 hypothetical protein [Paludibacteraceae bacterium]
MEMKNENGQISVATSADNFNEIIVSIGRLGSDFIKYTFHKYGFMKLGDGLKLISVADDDSILRVTYPNGNYRNVVKNHSVGPKCNWKYITEQVLQIMTTHYDVPNPKNFRTFNDWANDLREYGFLSSEKRWAKIRADYEASYPGYDEMVARYSK